MTKQSEADSAATSTISGIGNNTGELDVLRDLIFCNQARDFTKRITDLDARLEAVRRELKSDLDTRGQMVAKTASDQNSTLRKDTTGRIDKEVQILGERIEQLTADLHELVDDTRRTVEARLDRMQDEANERIRALEADARRRDDELRAELLAVSAWLEDKKTSRHDLGQMLEEIGQRLQSAAQIAATEEPDKE